MGTNQNQPQFQGVNLLSDIPESMLWDLVTISGIALTFCFVWFLLVIGISIKVDQESAKARNPNFAIKGVKQTKVTVVILVFCMVYVVVSGVIDTVAQITMVIGFLVGASTLWRSANSLGSYSFASHAEWRKVRFKTYFQALLLTSFVFLLDRGKTYLEHAGYI